MYDDAGDENVPESNIAPVPSAPPPSQPKKRRPPEILLPERRNWLIHHHFARKDIAECKALIEEQLSETKGTCEYALHVKGLLLREEGRVQESLEVFQQCTLNDAKNADYLIQTARSLSLLGKHANAANLIDEAIALKPYDAEIYYWKAVCCRGMGDDRKAKEALKAATTLAKHEKSLLLWAKILRTEGDYIAAIDVYKKALECSPENSDTLTELGLVYMKIGSSQQAFEALGKALGFNPGHARAILAAGCMMQEFGDCDVALSKYRIAAQKWPDSAQLWNNIAMCYYGKKKFVAAMSCLKRASYLAPLDWKIVANLGTVYNAMQQHASAFNFMSAAINLHPHVPSLYSGLGVILVNLQDTTNAGKAYGKAMHLDTRDPVPVLNYAVSVLKQGNLEKASKLMHEFGERIRKAKDSKGQHKTDPNVIELGEKVNQLLQNGDKVSTMTLSSQ